MASFLEQAHQPGVVRKERMQITHHIQRRLRIRLDQAQGGFRLKRGAVDGLLNGKPHALQTLGHRPHLQAQTAAYGQAGQGFQHPQLVPGLNQHKFDPGIQYQAQIMNIVFHPHSLSTKLGPR